MRNYYRLGSNPHSLLSTIHYPLSTIHYQLSTINYLLMIICNDSAAILLIYLILQ
ncbi:MAG: hypothetical protein LBE12_10515 [Planctomycetaceae bacterium]|nr:hypothetical protein [Planctomycetaceae bacterium]